MTEKKSNAVNTNPYGWTDDVVDPELMALFYFSTSYNKPIVDRFSYKVVHHINETRI